jgi:periplasmic protein CpxP/Spy
MKSSYFKILAVALILAVLAAIGVSQTVKRAHLRADGAFGGGMWGGPGFGGPMLGHLARSLDLTDAQQSQVKEIMAKEKPTFQPLMLQMAQTNQQVRQLVLANGFDEAKVRELASQQTQTLTELTVQRARVESELLQVLTPDQKTKLSAIITEHQQRFMNHMQGQAESK